MRTLEEILEQYETFTYQEIENAYEDMLNECYEPVELAGMTIQAGDMKTIDPIMFRCGVADYSAENYAEHDNGEYFLIEDYRNAIIDFENQDEDEE